MAKKKNGQKRVTRHAGLPTKDHNSWRIRWVDANGKRRSKNFPNYQEAIEEQTRLKGEVQAIKDGRMPRQMNVPTFSKFVEKYYEPNRNASKRRPKDDESIIRRHLKEPFGSLPLNRITTEKVENLKAELRKKKLKPNTIRNILACLSAILHYAMEMDFLFRLPKIKKPKPERPEYNYLRSESDRRAFLNEAREKGPEVYALFATAIYTGMRAGELFGLRRSDIDFKKRLITVHRSFDKKTKSGKSRHIPILNVLYPILRKWRLQNKNKLVFPNEAGNMHSPSPRIVKFTFPEVLQKAELPKMRFHDLRHTFASHWVAKGGDLFKLQKILGHADQQMVQRYAHLAPEVFDSVRDIFGNEPPEAATVKELPIRKSK